MSGAEQVQWLMVAFAGVMVGVGLWMKHDVDKLDRRIEQAELRQAPEPGRHAAE